MKYLTHLLIFSVYFTYVQAAGSEIVVRCKLVQSSKPAKADKTPTNTSNSGSKPTESSTGTDTKPTTSVTDGSTDKPSSGGNDVPTYDEFCKAVEAYSTSGLGTPPKPSQEIYDNFVKYCGKMSKKEQAMFLANSIWETGGLQYAEEIACKTGSCSYGKFFGRGYLQLTHDYNYKAASKDIYNDENTLINNPDLVAKPKDAWRTALWFWEKNVQPVLKQNDAVNKDLFGYTVKVINGGLECPANDKAKKRLGIYNAIKSAWKIPGSPGVLTGC